MNITTILDALSLFRKGNEVANPEAWKDGGNAATLLIPVIVGTVKVLGDLGYGIQLDETTAIAIAGGVVAFVQFIVHNVSSKRAGLLPAKQPTKDVSIIKQPKQPASVVKEQTIVRVPVVAETTSEPTVERNTGLPTYFG